MKRGMLVDTKSLDLAKHFLQDGRNVSADDEMDLARAIQTSVEDWFDMQRTADDARG